MSLWQKFKSYLQIKKSKTIFAAKTVLSSPKLIMRWVIALNVGTLLITLYVRSVKKQLIKDELPSLFSKQTQIFSQYFIPNLLRRPIFNLYAKYYDVNLNEIQLPLQKYDTFSAFFTRKIKRQLSQQKPNQISSPCDGKILAFSEVTGNSCHLIKGISYSLSELVLGDSSKFIDQSIEQFLKRKKDNKLYHIVIYLAPGDYHRFHSPTKMNILKKMQIQGRCDSVSQNTLIKGQCKYQKNGRISTFSQWAGGLLTMVFVGALNVRKIHVNNLNNLNYGDEMGYFNLGSTIVMIVQAKQIKEWKIKQGDKIRYGDALFEY